MQADLSAPNCVATGGVFDNCSGEDIKNNDLYEWKNKFTGANVAGDTRRNTGLIDADACIAEYYCIELVFYGKKYRCGR